jgi:hypothetical protein
VAERTLAEDLDTMERSIRRLQIDWDKFFSGLERKPPYDIRIKLEALLRLYAHSEIRNSTERFRYQGLTARYNILSELWNKRLRAKEEGRAFGAHGLKAEILPPAPPPPPVADVPRAAAPAPRAPEAEIRVKNPERDVAAVQALYQRFLAERKRTGETAGVKYESFQKLIGQQTQRLLAEKGGQAVDFRLETKDGRVSLKAKVVK